MKSNEWRQVDAGLYVNDKHPGWTIQYNATDLVRDEYKVYTHSIYLEDVEQKEVKTLEQAIEYVSKIVTE